MTNGVNGMAGRRCEHIMEKFALTCRAECSGERHSKEWFAECAGCGVKVGPFLSRDDACRAWAKMLLEMFPETHEA